MVALGFTLSSSVTSSTGTPDTDGSGLPAYSVLFNIAEDTGTLFHFRPGVRDRMVTDSIVRRPAAKLKNCCFAPCAQALQSTLLDFYSTRSLLPSREKKRFFEGCGTCLRRR